MTKATETDSGLLNLPPDEVDGDLPECLPGEEEDGQVDRGIYHLREMDISRKIYRACSHDSSIKSLFPSIEY